MPRKPKLTPTFADQVVDSPPMAFTVSPMTIELTPPPPPQEKKALKVAVVGTAPASRMLAPWGDPTWEIWVCSPGNVNSCPRVTRWFEIHANLLWPEHASYGIPYVDWLKQQTAFPIYMQDKSLVPHAIPFPKDEMVKEFGPYFFTSSFAWMMALALHEGATEIGLYGVDMASKDEYILQRSGGHYFIQLAKQRGVKVHIPFESDLEQPPGLYGYAEATPVGRKICAREQELNARIAALVTQHSSIGEQITYLRGALEDIQYFKSIWIGAQENAREFNTT